MKKKILIFVSLLAGIASAHPHVFIDATIDLVFDEKGFVGVKNRWIFDLIYSQAMIAAGDKNQNGIFEADELPFYREQVVEAAREYSRFNYIGDGSQFFSPHKPKDLKVSVSKEGKLIVEFLNAFDIPALSGDYTMLVIAVTDPTNYILITTDMERSKIKAPDTIDVEYFVDSLSDITQFKNFSSSVKGLYVRFKKNE